MTPSFPPSTLACPHRGGVGAVRQLVRFGAWVCVLGTAHLVLGAAGDTLPGPAALADLPAWLARADPVRTAFAVLRVAGLGLTWYLTVLTALLLVARLCGAPGLLRLVDRAALPVVRQALHHAIGTGLTVALLGGTVPLIIGSAAQADPAPPVVVMQEVPVDGPAPPTMVVIDAGGTGGAHPLPDAPAGVEMVLLGEAPPASLPPDAPHPTAPGADSSVTPPSPPTTSSAPVDVTDPTSLPAAPAPPTAPPTMRETGPAPAAASTPGAAGADPAAADPAAAAPTTATETTTPTTSERPTGAAPETAPATATEAEAEAETETTASTDPSPAAAPAGPDAAAPARRTEWTVQAGDHLWHIAAVTLEQAAGRPVSDGEVARYWRALIAMNRDRLLAADDPDLIIPGQTFVLPSIGT